MYYVYILQSRQDGKLYIGYTADLRSRFREHNQGLSQATRHRQPFDLVYYEAFKAKKDAVVRERMIKQYKQGYTNLKKRISASLEPRKWGEESPDTILNQESR